MRLSDFVAQSLVDAGVEEIFSVTGGACMYLTNSFAKHPGLRVTYFAHENACVCGAESYFRLTGKLACVCVTSGPGSLNCVTGVHGAYCDSMGMIVISGQCDSRTVDLHGTLRQLGDQSVNICSIVAEITKYAEEILEPLTVKARLHHALYFAKSRRPGPVWLSIPVDVQSKEVDPEKMWECYAQRPWEEPFSAIDYEGLVSRLSMAQRPVILAGSGIRTAGAVEEFRALVDLLGIPVVTAYNGHDLMPSDHPYYIGRQGTIGDIAGNLAVQESDFLLILGSRCNIRSIGFNFDAFAPKAFKVLIDIDNAELNKPFPKIDMSIHADLKAFLRALDFIPLPRPYTAMIDWLQRCHEWKRSNPVVQPEYRDTPLLNPYVFIEQLFNRLREDDIVVCANGTATVATFQTAKIKEGQRLYTNGGSSAMGWGIGAAIGAARGAKPGQRVILIDGDGSLQMSTGDLATIEHNQLDILIFVLNNGGYTSIRQTQDRFFNGRYAGIDASSGVGFPDLELLAQAYGLRYELIGATMECLEEALGELGPSLCEVVVDPRQNFAPRIRFPMEEV